MEIYKVDLDDKDSLLTFLDDHREKVLGGVIVNLRTGAIKMPAVVTAGLSKQLRALAAQMEGD